VSEVVERCWGGPETLFVISSDLSHYHDWETAKQLDSATSRTIEELRIADLRGDRACGFLPIGGVLTAARDHGLHASTIDLRNSGDTAGPRDRVVGYGAYVVD
jgi:AmmeMemoRadiSam system protein B